jgi:hypothetical protein
MLHQQLGIRFQSNEVKALKWSERFVITPITLELSI